jgi:hypothetical protein
MSAADSLNRSARAVYSGRTKEAVAIHVGARAIYQRASDVEALGAEAVEHDPQASEPATNTPS